MDTAGRNLVDVVTVIQAIVDVDFRGDRLNDLPQESYG